MPVVSCIIIRASIRSDRRTGTDEIQSISIQQRMMSASSIDKQWCQCDPLFITVLLSFRYSTKWKTSIVGIAIGEQ